MAEIINFEEQSGWIKNVGATRKAAEFIGPTSNKINNHSVVGDDCIMDPTHYPDPPLAEYIASAGYPKDDGEPIK